MANLLLELFGEEIPARMQNRAAKDLKAAFVKVCDENQLTYGSMGCLVTPRRLCLTIQDLPDRQPSRTIERRGPKINAPEKARQGFLKSLGEGHYELTEQEEPKGTFLVATFHQEGLETRALLSKLIPEILEQFTWPKSMRWGDGETRWVRPIHHIACLLEGQVVPFRFADIESGRSTCGHRFMANSVIEVLDTTDYLSRLAAAKVMVDQDHRRRVIAERANILAEGAGLRVRDDAALFDELAGLVEWPVPLMGRIDQRFMNLPVEVLVTSMREHQKFIALETQDGALADRFILVANIEAPDGGEAIIQGNERVLRARLWDAQFFWDQDRKLPLGDLLPQLDKVVFHAALGSLGQKVRRIERLARHLAEPCGTRAAIAARAARHAKADLVSGMVGEFPELQGIMGSYYARAQNFDQDVVLAIREHYSPLGPSDQCPNAPASIAVALADKLDTLAGFFAVGIKPTGSKDPFALRRATLGIIRLIVENGIRLSLREVFHSALEGYREHLDSIGTEITVEELLSFTADRLIVHLRGQGRRHDLIAAVFGAAGDDDLVRLLTRVAALEDLLTSEDGRNLLAAYRRGGNILRIEERKDKTARNGNVREEHLVEPSEIILYKTLNGAKDAIEQHLSQESYIEAMRALASLRTPVDDFFTQVLVNAEEAESRSNRLELLASMRTAFDLVADFSVVEESGRTGTA